MKKVLVFSDFDTIGSGYRNICAPLFTELMKMDYDVKIIGLSNKGEEHPYPFSVIPTQNVEEAEAMMGNMIQLWQPEIIIVAMDLPFQARLHARLSQYLPETKMPDGSVLPRKYYIAITPLENGPLCMSWAAPLFNMDAVFFISELGKVEAQKVGVSKAEHLQIGVDTVSWRSAFPEEKIQLRKGLGIPEEAFVVLTVADNQERKNLWAGMEAISKLKKETERPIKYVLVTREQSPFGWKLRDLAVSLGINQEYTPFERGMSQKDLWGLYAISDVYLQTSKAEGLGLPVLDAMCCKIPVVATDTGALHELLDNKRGYLVPAEYVFTDVWGNSSRSMINIVYAKDWMSSMITGDVNPTELIERAYEFVKQRTWNIPAKQLDSKIRELLNEPKTETPA